MRRLVDLRRILSACAALPGCAGALLCVAASAAAQEPPEGFEEGLYQVAVPPLTSVDLPALVSPTGAVLLPLSPVLELTGTPFEVSADGGRVSVARPRGVGTAVLDLSERSISAGRRTPLAAGDAVRFGGEIFVALGPLAELLEGTADLDQSALRVTLSRDPPFVAQERALLAEARARRSVGRDRTSGLTDVPFRPETGAGVLEWGVSSVFPDAGVPSSVFARAGLGVWGGMLRLGATTFSGSGPESGVELTAAYHRVFPRARWVRQVQVGDLVTEGLRARSIRGAAVTNAPFVRDALFGEALFAPDLPAGWEYEVYQDGQLLGYSTTAGQAVPVPLRYGSTPVQVQLYGPAGERIRTDVVYLVPTLQLPRGHFQYAAGAGACPAGHTCDSFSYLDLRHGATAALTLIAGAELEADSAGSELRPYAGVSLLPAPGWQVEAQAMPGSFARISAQNLGAGRVSGGFGAGVVWPGSGGESVIGSGGFSAIPDTTPRWHAEGALRLRLAPPGVPGRTLELGSRLDGSRERGLDRVRLSASGTLRGLLVEGAFEQSAAGADTAADRRLFLLSALAAVGRWAPRWLGSPVLSGTVGTGDGGLERWEAGITSTHPGAVLTLSTRWSRGQGDPALLLGTTIRLGPGRAQARAGVRSGRADGGVTVSGALAFGRGAGVEPLAFGGLGSAGVSGRVFHDLNGDGRYGPGDEPVARAFVGVGSTRVPTDAGGRYATWSVVPYEVTAVRLDTATLADPAWVPARRDVLLRPSPHLYTPVDFALVRTRELAGALVAGPGVTRLGGVTVEIVRLGTGEVQRAVTFSDGEFYLGRVLPGEYEARVAESSLRALGAAPDPASVRFTIPAAGDPPLVEVPPIRLTRRAP